MPRKDAVRWRKKTSESDPAQADPNFASASLEGVVRPRLVEHSRTINEASTNHNDRSTKYHDGRQSHQSFWSISDHKQVGSDYPASSATSSTCRPSSPRQASFSPAASRQNDRKTTSGHACSFTPAASRQNKQNRQMTASKRSCAVVWHKWTDLRLDDHEPAVHAHRNFAEMLHVHLIPRSLLHYESRSREAKLPRCSPLRAKFWMESILDLDARLRAASSGKQYLHVEMIDDIGKVMKGASSTTTSTSTTKDMKSDKELLNRDNHGKGVRSTWNIKTSGFADFFLEKLRLDQQGQHEQHRRSDSELEAIKPATAYHIVTHSEFCKEELEIEAELRQRLLLQLEPNLESSWVESSQVTNITFQTFWGGQTLTHIDDLGLRDDPLNMPEFKGEFNKLAKSCRLRQSCGFPIGRFSLEDVYVEKQKMVATDVDLDERPYNRKTPLSTRQEGTQMTPNAKKSCLKPPPQEFGFLSRADFEKQIFDLFDEAILGKDARRNYAEKLLGLDNTLLAVLDEEENLLGLDKEEVEDREDYREQLLQEVLGESAWKIMGTDHKTNPYEHSSTGFEHRWLGGETAARTYLTDFFSGPEKLWAYRGATESFAHGEEHNPIFSGTRLSPWLAFGNVSARQVLKQARECERRFGKKGSSKGGKNVIFTN